MRIEFSPRSDERWCAAVAIYLPSVYGQHQALEAIVDSGASVSVISPDVFGAALPPCEPDADTVELGTAAGIPIRARALRSLDVVLESPDGERLRLSRCRLHVADSRLPVAILLGLEGFFEHIHIAFRFDPVLPEASFFQVRER